MICGHDGSTGDRLARFVMLWNFFFYFLLFRYMISIEPYGEVYFFVGKGLFGLRYSHWAEFPPVVTWIPV